MTKQEAIRDIKAECIGCCHPQAMEYCERNCEYGIAIECIEKQIPKKPRITIHNGFCPNCKNAFGKKYVEDAVIHPYWKGYCPVCGQAIDWSDNE